MSTVPGNPALPAPLAPAMHPGDRDTHLDLDDLIDHSHEATQQARKAAGSRTASPATPYTPVEAGCRAQVQNAQAPQPRCGDASGRSSCRISQTLCSGHCRHHHHVDSGMDVQRSGVSYPATTVPDGGRAATGTDEHHIQWRGLRIQRKAGDCVLPWSDGLLPVVVIPSVGIH